MANKVTTENSGMILVVTFLATLVVNALVIYLANSFFPYWVVLGTLTISLWWAVFHSMAALALIGTFAIPFVRKYEKSRGKMFSSMEWMAVYFVVNLVGIWVIARFPEQFGLGIRSWMVAVILAVILDFLQGMVMMQLEKYRSKIS